MQRIGSILHGAYGDYYEQLMCLKHYKRQNPDTALVLFFAESSKLREMRVFDLSFADEVLPAEAISKTHVDNFLQYQVKDEELRTEIFAHLSADILAKIDMERNLKPWHGLRDMDMRDPANAIDLSAEGRAMLPEILACNGLREDIFKDKFTIGFLWRYREPGGYVRTFGQTSEEKLLQTKSELFQYMIREKGAHVLIAGMNVAVTQENRERISGKYTERSLDLDPDHCTYLKGLNWGLEMEIMRRCSLCLLMPSGFSEALWMKRAGPTLLLDAPPDYLLRALYNRMPIHDLDRPKHFLFQLRQPHTTARVLKQLTHMNVKLPESTRTDDTISNSTLSNSTLSNSMTGCSIVCFAKDWTEDPTSCNHVLREFSKTNRVLWLNSISTRAPSLSSGRDMKKIVQKIKGFLQGPKQVADQMWVYTPLVLPWHNNPLAVRINRLVLRATIMLLTRRLKMRPFQLWTWVPTSSAYLGHMGESLAVYYCTDNWEKFRGLDSERIGKMVQDLGSRADVVFATSDSLAQKLLPLNAQTHLAAHGVDHAFFARALEPSTPIPADLAALPQPVLGFYGLIEDWLDQELIAMLARRHPEWSIALVGRTCVDVSLLESLPNVHFLGRKLHAELPLYCKGFAVGLIPHKVNELTRHMNPIKLREYLSAGLPVVATALPEVRHYGELCHVTESYSDFERAIETVLREDTPAARRHRSDAMQWETWERKVAELGHKVAAVKAGKQSQKAGLITRNSVADFDR